MIFVVVRHSDEYSDDCSKEHETTSFCTFLSVTLGNRLRIMHVWVCVRVEGREVNDLV